jgi:hypothetical protein
MTSDITTSRSRHRHGDIGLLSLHRAANSLTRSQLPISFTSFLYYLEDVIPTLYTFIVDRLLCMTSGSHCHNRYADPGLGAYVTLFVVVSVAITWIPQSSVGNMFQNP